MCAKCRGLSVFIISDFPKDVKQNIAEFRRWNEKVTANVFLNYVLDDEVKKLVEGKDTAFLFEKSTGTKFKGAKSAEKGDGAGSEGGMTLEKLKAMNPLDRYNYSVNHPDEYKELYGGNE